MEEKILSKNFFGCDLFFKKKKEMISTDSLQIHNGVLIFLNFGWESPHFLTETKK